MGIIRLLTTKNGLAFLVCNLLGYIVARLFPPGTPAFVVSMLVSYHLFLVWLLISADRALEFLRPTVTTVLTHLGCVAVVTALPIARHAIPFFYLFRFGVIYIATFESKWLFDAAELARTEAELAPSVSASSAPGSSAANAWVPAFSAESGSAETRIATADDSQQHKLAFVSTTSYSSDVEKNEMEWLAYLSQPIRVYRKPGVTMKDEHKQWLAAREKTRAKAAASADKVNALQAEPSAS